MEICYSGMSNEALIRTMNRARMDADNALSSNSPIKMIMYDIAYEAFTKAHEEYCKRLKVEGC